MASYVNTRLLIISDTHAADLPHKLQVTAPVDVIIHCGDLTEESKISEFRKTLDLLKASTAPLKLVIAGNHDWTLDLPTFRQKVKNAKLESEPALVAREYGDYGEVRRLFDEARDTDNIHLLDEGTHRFTLSNGARLTVYASPFTPSVDADWGFQYRVGDDHTYDIGQGDESPDIVLTHGPPQGVLDRTADQKRLGCPQLFAAVARSRPLVHCFGHVHASWAARHIAWRENISADSTPTHFTAIDNGKSSTIDSLQSYQRLKFDDDAAANYKAARLAQLNEKGYREANLVSQDGTDECWMKTLCVNAAIQGDDNIPFHVPWVVNVPLQKADDV